MTDSAALHRSAGALAHRFVLLPKARYPSLRKMYKQHVASFWVPEEIDLSHDLEQWDKLSADERHFISHVLAFFAGSDGIVIDNLVKRFVEDVQDIPEAKQFYTFQATMEMFHAETYTLLIDTYIRDTVEKAHLLNALDEVACIRQKAEWAIEFIDNDAPFVERLVAFACVEGIMFSGSFCAIYWLKKRGLMPGLCRSNELIARDEGLHCDFACELKKVMGLHLPQERVWCIVDAAVVLECAFVCDALPCRLIGMNADAMALYIQFVADRLLDALGYEKKYHAANPFEWMEAISLQGKANFFEARETSYQKAGVFDDGPNVMALDSAAFHDSDF